MRPAGRNIITGALMVIFISVFLAGSVFAQSKGEIKTSSKNDSGDTDVLNGLDFRGKMGMLGEADGKDEELRFKDGMFQSALSEENGFVASDYTVEKGADEYTLHFYSESTNSKGDRMLWHGTVKLDHTGLTRRHKVEAYATFMPVGESSRLFWMKGTASKLSMKYSGKNAPVQMQTASKEGSF